ncbi:MAG TPA: type II toxin-antitoxin system ParD family antitoxin [Cytophagales bacterium]|nr:type II toxin-antitoxin system ParD family antitoxin [Cytophagales bacterium]HAA24431.1 type II toxin-antitoxin system ParD family antitoxin [Cytophagales bacterium]HAP59667.1 type II toxin-antitoxin system ParD family antitoxin [Cytophagales bacterium]
MNKNTSVSLGTHFDEFVQQSIAEGRFKNASEVIRAGLRLLEEEENKVIALKKVVNEGLGSPKVEGFDFDEHLQSLKSRRK